MAEEITKEEYYKAIGLIELAKQKNNQLRDIEKALAETLDVGEDKLGGYGHVSDCVFGELYDVDTLLRKQNIEIKEDEVS